MTDITSKHIILIHGLHQTHWIMKPLARRFKQAGYLPHCFHYASLMQSIEQHSAKLNAWLENEVDVQPFHMIGHSLGGLVIRDFLHRYPRWLADNQVERIVTLGTPHLGSTTAHYTKQLLPIAIGKAYKGALDGEVADLSDKACLGVIAGNKSQGLGKPLLSYHNHVKQLNAQQSVHDGTVYVFETMLANASDHIILPVTHTGMLIDKQVFTQSLYFLEHGQFQH